MYGIPSPHAAASPRSTKDQRERLDPREPVRASSQLNTYKLGVGPRKFAQVLCYAPANQCSAVPFRIIELLSILAAEAWAWCSGLKMFGWAAK